MPRTIGFLSGKAGWQRLLVSIALSLGLDVAGGAAWAEEIRVAIAFAAAGNALDNGTIQAKAVFEEYLRSELATFQNVKPRVLTRADFPGEEGIDSFVSSNRGPDIYIVGWFAAQLGSEWMLPWEIVEVRPQPATPIRHRQAPIRLGASFDQVRSEVAAVTSAFVKKVPGAKRHRAVYVSCFLLRLTRELDPAMQTALQTMQLQLPGRLTEGLAAQLGDYTFAALSMTDVQAVCVNSQTVPGHTHHKARADYIIEGLITTPELEQTLVTVSIYRSATGAPVEIEGILRKKKFDVGKAFEDLAKSIVVGWPKVLR